MRIKVASGKNKFVIIFLLLTIRVFTQTESWPVEPTKNSGGETRTQTDTAKQITLPEAIELAFKQASNYQTARLSEQIAAEDVRQAKADFYPKISAQPTIIYTTPSLTSSINPRPPSFLGANAVTEYQAVFNASGEIDLSGKLKATLGRDRALFAAAQQGSEIARRELVQAVSEAYFNLALATTKRRGAELNLRAAEEFEATTKLLLDAGEVAPVDLVRARLQTSGRRDELEQLRAEESVNADAFRVLIGYDFTQPVSTGDLLTQMPEAGEIDRYTEAAIQTRPEFAQLAAERQAAEQEVKIAQSLRKPQITYSINGGFISDSLKPKPIADSTGIQATVGVSIPIFDWGSSRSKETQARLRIQQNENNRQLAERQFIQQFYTARTQAISAAARIRQLAQSIRDAEMNVTASTARYRAGEAQINEVTDAQNLLVAQKLALYQAIFDYQTARARLLRAIGK